MKKIIRFLADISGVTDDTYCRAVKDVGDCMYQNAYWWNGGIMHKEPKWEVWNAFFKYAYYLKRGVISPNMMSLREEVYELGNKPFQKELQDRLGQ